MATPPKELVLVRTDPPGADIIWMDRSLGKTGQTLEWSRVEFQKTPGLDARFCVTLRKEGFRDQTLWLDADLWRLHEWPAGGQVVALQPARWDAHLTLWARHWGLPVLIFSLVVFTWLLWLRRRGARQDSVLTLHLPELVGQAMTGGGESETLEVAVVFLDRVRVDTELCNQYFEDSTGAISRHGGQVVRTVGEQILALFPGAAEGSRAAVRAALEASQASLARGLHTHCGIHHGQLVSTTLGTSQRQWTLVGDHINVAARIQGLAKTMGSALLVSQVVQEHCDALAGARFASKGRHNLRGRRQSVELFEVLTCPLEGPPR